MTSGPRGGVDVGSGIGIEGARAASAVSTALLAHQLPPLAKFDGGASSAGDGETIREWLEQFELVAGVCKWDSQATW